MIKISFLGDIMCEGPFLGAAKKNGEYDFRECFAGLKDFLSASDFVIGNLETPVTDTYTDLTRTKDLYSFNTPKEFLAAVKDAGINMLLTANNHCLDRGISGLNKTLELLDRYGFYHTGTYPKNGETVFHNEIGGVTFSIISCTSGTNAEVTKITPSLEQINLIGHENPDAKRSLRQVIIKDVIGLNNYMKIRKALGKTALNPVTDNSFNKEETDKLLARLEMQIDAASEKSEFVFVCPHMGGQFNLTPGAYSEYVMQRLSDTKASAVLASHPHILQKCEYRNGKPVFFSIGNVSMSMGTEYQIMDNHPDLGAIINIYLEKNAKPELTCTIIRIIEEPDGYIKVFPICDLIESSGGQRRSQLIEEYRTAKAVMGIGDDSEDISREIPVMRES